MPINGERMSDCLKKCVKNKACSAGRHTYICAAWKISPDKKVCDLFVCQHCMVPFTKQEREVMSRHHNSQDS